MADVIKQEKVPVEWSGGGVQLGNLDEAYRFATAIAKSGLAGNARPEQILVQLQAGMELGMQPMESFTSIHVIKGRASIAVAQQAALVERNGGLAKGTKLVAEFSGDKQKADWTCTVTSHPVGSKKPVISSVQWSDFKHLSGGDNWTKYPERMMKARAVGYHIRDYYQAYIAPSMAFTEEMEDYAAMKTITPVADPDAPDPLLELLEPIANPAPEPEPPTPTAATDDSTGAGAASDDPYEW